MSVRISWPANPESDVVAYEVERASDLTGPFTAVATIPVSAYDPVAKLFSWVDSSDPPTPWYRLVAIDSLGARSAPSAPFEPLAAPPAVSATVKLDHHYGRPDALRLCP